MNRNEAAGMGGADIGRAEVPSNAPVPQNRGVVSRHDSEQAANVAGPALRQTAQPQLKNQVHRAQRGPGNQKISNVVVPHFARAGRGDGTQTVYENALEEVQNISVEAAPQSYIIRTAGQPKVPTSAVQMIRIRVGLNPEKGSFDKKSPRDMIEAFRARAVEVKKAAELYFAEAVKSQQKAVQKCQVHELNKSSSPQQICDYATWQLEIKQANRDMAFGRLVQANRDRQHAYADWLLAGQDLDMAHLEVTRLTKRPHSYNDAEWERAKNEANLGLTKAKDKVKKTLASVQSAKSTYQSELENYTVASKQLLEQTAKTFKIFETQCQSVYRELKEKIPKNDAELSQHRQYVLFATNLASKISAISHYNKNHPNAIYATQYEKLLKGVLEQLRLPLSRAKEFLKAAQKEVDGADASLKDFNKTNSGNLSRHQVFDKNVLDYTLAKKKYILAQKQTAVKGAQFAIDLIEYSVLKSQPAPDEITLNSVKAKLEGSLLDNDQAETNEAAAKTVYMKAKVDATVDQNRKRTVYRDYLVAAAQEEFFRFLQARNQTAYFSGKKEVTAKFTIAKQEAREKRDAYMAARNKLRSTQARAALPVLRPERVTARPSRPPPASIAPDAGQIAQSSAAPSPSRPAHTPTNAAVSGPLAGQPMARTLSTGERPTQQPLSLGSLPSAVASVGASSSTVVAPAQPTISAPPSVVELHRAELQQLKDKNSQEKARVEEFKRLNPDPDIRLKAQIDALESQYQQNLDLEKFKTDHLELLEKKEKNAKQRAEIDALKKIPQPDQATQDKLKALEEQYKQNHSVEAKLEAAYFHKELVNLKSNIDKLEDGDPKKAPQLKLYNAARLDIWTKYPKKLNSEMTLNEIVNTETTYLNNLRIVQRLSELYNKPELIKFVKDNYPDKATRYLEALRTVNENIGTLIAVSGEILSKAKEGLEKYKQSILPEDKNAAADQVFAEIKKVFSQLSTTDAYISYINAYNDSVDLSFLEFRESNDGQIALRKQLEKIGLPIDNILSNIYGYMINPVQRIPRYKLLLEEYAKKSSDIEDLGIVSNGSKAALEKILKTAETINQFTPQEPPLKNQLQHLQEMLKFSNDNDLSIAKQKNIFKHDSIICVNGTKSEKDSIATVKYILTTIEKASRADEIGKLKLKINASRPESPSEREALTKHVTNLATLEKEEVELKAIAGEALEALKNNRWAMRVINNNADLNTNLVNLAAKYSQPLTPIVPQPADQLLKTVMILASIAALSDQAKVAKIALKNQGLSDNIADLLGQLFQSARTTMASSDPHKQEAVQQLVAIIHQCPWLKAELQNEANLFNEFLSLQANLASIKPPVILSSNPEDLMNDLTSMNIAMIRAANPTSVKDGDDAEIRLQILNKKVNLHATLSIVEAILKAAKSALDSAETSEEHRKQWETVQELAAKTTLKSLIEINDELVIPGFQEKIDAVEKLLIPKKFLEVQPKVSPMDLMSDLTSMNIKFEMIRAAILPLAQGEKLDSHLRSQIREKKVDLHTMLRLTKTALRAAKSALASEETSEEHRGLWETLQELAAQKTLKILTETNDILKIPGFKAKIDAAKSLLPEKFLEDHMDESSEGDYPFPDSFRT